MKQTQSKSAGVHSTSPVLAAARWRTRAGAFLVTTLAVLTIGSLTWPLSVRGYRSEATIQLGQLSDAQRQELLSSQVPRALQSVLADLPTANRLARVQDQVNLDSRVLSSGDTETVNQRISIGLSEGGPVGGSQLRVVFVGDGYQDERFLVDLLARDIEQALEANITSHFMSNATAVGQRDTFQRDQLERADWLVSQIEDGLAAARDQTVTLIEGAEPAKAESAFRSVGHIREIDQPAAGRLHQTLESVDVESLRSVIEQMKKRGETSASTSAAGHNAATSVTQTPVGAVPERKAVLLLMFLSLLVGGAVAWNCQPFSAVGFESVDAIAESLQVPVVATIHTSGPGNDEGVVHRGRPWANRVAELGSTVLFAASLVIGGFWFFYASVRVAFADGVFHGLARIVWMLTGA